MSKSLAALVSAVVMLCAQAALAGVVINEHEDVTGAMRGAHSGERIVMVQGNKEKLVVSPHVFIIDLDQGRMYMLNNKNKSYAEIPFPPSGMMAQLMGGPGLHTSNFAPNGKSRTVAGYKCDEYAGSGKYTMGEYSIVQCVSNKVPGAKEFRAFQHAMLEKLRSSAPVKFAATLPPGVPLTEDTTVKIVLNPAEMAKLPPKVAEQLKAQFANRPPMVTKIEVTKIATKKLAQADFRPPAGFTKSALMPGPVGLGHPQRPPHFGTLKPPAAGQPPAAPPSSPK
jgi:Domain of unknown function (DUF4412)